MSFKDVIQALLGLPKTIYFNFHFFHFRTAMKLPILFSSNVKFGLLKGKIVLEQNPSFGLVKIGFLSSSVVSERAETFFGCQGCIRFEGKANIGKGCRVISNKVSCLIFGNHFVCTGGSCFICSKKIVFGKDCLVSWGCLFLDTDFHHVYKNGKLTNEDRPIFIGNHVWVGCRSCVLKNVTIPSGCIIAEGSNVVYSSLAFLESSLIGGNPAKIVGENIEWQI